MASLAYANDAIEQTHGSAGGEIGEQGESTQSPRQGVQRE